MSDDCIDNVGITNDVSDVEIVEDTLSEITVTEEAVTIVASCDEIIVSPSPDELFYVDVTDETVEINITEDAVTITTDCAQGIPGAPGVASWDNTFSYSIDDVIYYDGNFYVSLTSNTNSQPDTNPSDWTQITTSGGGGAVDSVNAYTGTVVLDPDDLDDTSTTNKFTNATDISRLANTSGTNTGDQDLSSYLTAVDVDGFYRSNHIEVISTDTTLTDAGTYLIFNVGAPAHLQLTLPDPSTMEGEEVFIVNTPFGFVDVIGPIDGGAGAILPLNTFIAYRAVQLPPAFGGTWLWGSAQRAGVPYDLPDWYNFATGASGVPVDYAVTMNDPGDGIVRPIWKDISPPVDSVNTQTGAVVLDADGIDDTSTTNKFTNTTDISRLANTSGTNTGDQDLSGKQDVLVSGTNIKTINGSSILGAGDLTLSTGSTGLALADQEYTSTYVYVGMDSGAGWQIYRRTRTTNVRQYASGVSDYSTAWTNRVGLIYS